MVFIVTFSPHYFYFVFSCFFFFGCSLYEIAIKIYLRLLLFIYSFALHVLEQKAQLPQWMRKLTVSICVYMFISDCRRIKISFQLNHEFFEFRSNLFFPSGFSCFSQLVNEFHLNIEIISCRSSHNSDFEHIALPEWTLLIAHFLVFDYI